MPYLAVGGALRGARAALLVVALVVVAATVVALLEDGDDDALHPSPQLLLLLLGRRGGAPHLPQRGVLPLQELAQHAPDAGAAQGLQRARLVVRCARPICEVTPALLNSLRWRSRAVRETAGLANNDMSIGKLLVHG